MASIIIRDANLNDIQTCQKLELSAANKFSTCDVEAISALDFSQTLPAEILQESIGLELCFISEIESEPVGFIALRQFENSWYILELSIAEHAQSQGVGNALLTYIKMLAEIKRIPSINLITFKDVSFNMPYYLTKGYQLMAVERLSEQFKKLWLADGLNYDSKLRVCMQLKIDIDKF